jgi:hypothetical protein
MRGVRLLISVQIAESGRHAAGSNNERSRPECRCWGRLAATVGGSSIDWCVVV